MVSGLGVAVALAGLGLHYYLLESHIDPMKIQWLPLSSIVCFVVTYTIGFMSVPNTALSEMFPDGVKSMAACIMSFTSAILGFIAAKAYQPMVDVVGEAYVFWIHGTFAALAIPVALFWMPETKGKSFQEIQNDLHKSH